MTSSSAATRIELPAAVAPGAGDDPTASWSLAWLVAVAGIVVTLLAAWFVRDRWDHAVRDRIGAMAGAENARLVGRLAAAEDVLRGVAAHAAISEREGEWSTYVDRLHLAVHHPEMSRPVLLRRPAGRREGVTASRVGAVDGGTAGRGRELRALLSAPFLRGIASGGEEIAGTVESTVVLTVGDHGGTASPKTVIWTLGDVSESAVRAAAGGVTGRDLVVVSLIEHGGCRWWLAATPAPDFFRDFDALDPNVVLSTGLCLTGIGVVALVFVQRRRPASTEAGGEARAPWTSTGKDSVPDLQRVIDALPNPLFVKSDEARWVAVNEAFCRLVGRPREALLGHTDADLLPAEHAARNMDEDAIVRRTGTGRTFEERLVGADGTERWLLKSKSPIRLADGTTFLVGISTDISDRRRHEQSVLAARHRLQLVNDLTAGVVRGLRRVDVVRLAVDQLAATQPGSRVTFATSVGDALTAERVSGGADLPVIGEDRFAVRDAVWESGIAAGLPMAINDGTRDGAYPALTAHLRAAGISAVLEVAVRGEGGMLGRIAVDRRQSHAWTNDERQTVIAVADAVAVVLGYLRANADREAAEQSMRNQEDVLQAVIWATDLGVWTWDVAAGTVQWSAEAERQLGYAENDLAGTWDDWQSRVHPDDLDRVLAELQARLDAGADRFESEFRLRHRDGHWIHILSRARIRRDDGGAPVRLLGGHLDVTEFRQVQEALRNHRDELEGHVAERTAQLLAAKNAAEAANRAKSEFLANMSHELRTPMHAILSFAQLGISRSGDTAKTRQYLDRIDTSGRRLLGLLNDLLDLSKLEAGAMQYDFGSHSIRAIANAAVQEFAVLAGERRIGVVLDAESIEAWCDPARIGQVLRNLLSNAIRFTPVDGSVRLTVRAAGIDDGTLVLPAVRVVVEDNGVGIPNAELETVFDKFIQSSKTRSGAGGTGLGLAICREIVSQHRGVIRAEATAGGGATIVMLLPREPLSHKSDSVHDTRSDIA